MTQTRTVFKKSLKLVEKKGLLVYASSHSFPQSTYKGEFHIHHFGYLYSLSPQDKNENFNASYIL